MTATLFLLSLFWAAAMDVKRGEVQNGVWIPAVFALPLAIYRIVEAGLLLLYTMQVGFVFALMLLCFYVGLLGGADGKAILLMSVTCPWLKIDAPSLSIGPLVACLAALAIEGFESLCLALLNLDEWYRYPLLQRQISRPEKKRFWFTRRLLRKGEARKPSVWKKAAMPLVLYVLVAYLLLLVCNMAV
jgi:Flp pilus assembly protein protease CpaA